MKCLECGSLMKVRKEDYRFSECGLRYVTLIGLEVGRCTRCDYSEASIPRIEALHRLIARALIEKTTRLTGEEVRFLRKLLDWSGSEFAKHIGVAEETVSRWENDAIPIGPQADRLLRLMVAQGSLTTCYPTEKLARINPKKATVTKLGVGSRGRRWEVLAA